MIGMAGKDRHCPINLFGDQYTHKLMRKGHRAKRTDRRRALSNCGVEPLRTANGEPKRFTPNVSLAADKTCEGGAVDRTASFVENDQRFLAQFPS